MLKHYQGKHYLVLNDIVLQNHEKQMKKKRRRIVPERLNCACALLLPVSLHPADPSSSSCRGAAALHSRAAALRLLSLPCLTLCPPISLRRPFLDMPLTVTVALRAVSLVVIYPLLLEGRGV